MVLLTPFPLSAFRTDTDISQKKSSTAGGGGKERELQAWVPSSDALPARPAGGVGDEDTFGLGANGNSSWDQFYTNEKLFGVKASFDEDVYTTKLDRNAPDFKDRERKAQKIANEIIGATTNNPHIAEERGLVVDDSGADEEDKYVFHFQLCPVLIIVSFSFCGLDMELLFEDKMPMCPLVRVKQQLLAVSLLLQRVRVQWVLQRRSSFQGYLLMVQMELRKHLHRLLRPLRIRFVSWIEQTCH